MGGYFPTTPSTGAVGTNKPSVGATAGPRQIGGSNGRRPRTGQLRPRAPRAAGQTAGVQVNALQPAAGTQGNWF